MITTRFSLALLSAAAASLAPPMQAKAADADTALRYPIVDTGQSAHFDANGSVPAAVVAAEYPEQDADHRGNPPSYRANGDGTVTDLVTGLMWEQAEREIGWADAAAAAAAASTGGYTDWRVPTIKELYSLILFTGNQGTGDPASRTAPADAVPFIDTGVFDFAYHEGGRYIDAQNITSTRYVAQVMGGESCFFGVNFADGRIKCYPLVRPPGAGLYHLRLVRGNPAYGQNAFIDNGDGTVTDAATGLMWTQVDSGDPALDGRGALGWGEALQVAAGSSYAGHDDWRLPNAKELQSIVDYSRAPDATGSAALDPVFAVSPVVNAGGAADFPAYWSSTSFEPGRDAVVVYFGRALGYFAPSGYASPAFLDVHGAGAQRTDPKAGRAGYGFGPQGDVRNVANYVRLVREAD